MQNAIPLFLLHGALGSGEQFAPVVERLTSLMPVFHPNLPGHGGVTAPGAFQIPQLADGVLRYFDLHKVSGADIFGYSLGGYVALYLAWKHPDRVRSVYTLGTKFDWTPESAARETARLDPDLMEAKVPQFTAMLHARHVPADWREVTRMTARLMTDLGNGPDLHAAVWQQITCPVIIGRGELDTMVTEAESTKVAQALPNGNYEEWPQTKHPLEQVDMELMLHKLTAWRNRSDS